MPLTVQKTTDDALAKAVKKYYAQLFIKQGEGRTLLLDAATKKSIVNGKTIEFDIVKRIGKSTSALTEGADPDQTDIEIDTVEATIAEWGQWTPISSLFIATTRQAFIEEIVKAFGRSHAETLEWQLMLEAVTGAGHDYFAGGGADLASLTDTTNTSADDLVKIRASMRSYPRNVPTYGDGLYYAYPSVDAMADLFNDPDFREAYKYQEGEKIQKNKAMVYGGIKLHEYDLEPYMVDNAGTQGVFDGTPAELDTDVFNINAIPVLGKDALGSIELGAKAGKGYKGTAKYGDLIVKRGIDNLDRYSTVGWCQPHVAKVLNPTNITTYYATIKDFALPTA